MVRTSLTSASFGLVAFAACFASAANVETLTDVGNGVHVPGQIPANPFDPLQHRLAFGGPGEMTVSWSTFTKLGHPEVYYGQDPKQLLLASEDCTSTTYPTSRTWNNHCLLKNLKPGTLYYYKVSFTNCAYCAYRPLFTFETARAAGDETPFTIAVFADLGLMGHDGRYTGLSTASPAGSDIPHLGVNETNTIQSLLTQKDTYSFALHTGDIGYADYFLKESIGGYFGPDFTSPSMEQDALRYESLTEQFYDQMTPVTATTPYMVAPGNHEANCDNGLKKYGDQFCLVGQTNFTGYIEHWRMPTKQSHKSNNFWYSFDYGMAHFISLDTETDLGHGLSGPIQNISTNHNGPFGGMNEQVDWLVADLKSVDRAKTPWVIVQLHRPWYTQVDPPVWPAWQEAFEQVFYDNEVDLYLQGHVHVYERQKPLFNGTIDPNGLNNPRAPWNILHGNAGHYDGLDTFTQKNDYLAFGTDQSFGWGRLTFHNRTHLTYEFIDSNTDVVIDEATLYKKHDFSTPSLPTTSKSMSSATRTSTSAASSATVKKCSKTSDCQGSSLPTNAHNYCDNGTCSFRCNKNYVLSDSKKTCVYSK